MRGIVTLLFFACILSSCSQRTFVKKLTRELTSIEKKYQDNTGFLLYDPASKKTLIEYNSSQYFTPASNTKILTFYTSLQLLGDSIPALKYTVRNDSLIFWGTGDPSFLYRNVGNNTHTYDFLKNAPQQLYFSSSNFQTDHFGPGWAWDDYNFAFSSERTPFPVYGNFYSLASMSNDSLKVMPAYFSPYLIQSKEIRNAPQVVRHKDSNHVTFYPGKRKLKDTLNIPFRYNDDLLADLLTDTLKRKVTSVNTQQPLETQVLYSTPSDSVYRELMEDSDNFIAEQLLLLCADAVSDTLKTDIAIAYSKKNFLFDLPDKPLWRDGSGLSRYNLLTPRSIVRVWEKVYAKVPADRLFKLLATGGESGTIKNYFKAEKPYIFGKTGTLSNNYSLSGFLVTKKGKTLIFSWMNNNYPTSVTDVRKNMEPVLKSIHDHY
jgi:D-alanyl-D-alanine carboxypeptidase/D-alanyl-D-alanine-endopeptidase (penicillin-binding protein 4)